MSNNQVGEKRERVESVAVHPQQHTEQQQHHYQPANSSPIAPANLKPCGSQHSSNSPGTTGAASQTPPALPSCGTNLTGAGGERHPAVIPPQPPLQHQQSSPPQHQPQLQSSLSQPVLAPRKVSLKTPTQPSPAASAPGQPLRRTDTPTGTRSPASPLGGFPRVPSAANQAALARQASFAERVAKPIAEALAVGAPAQLSPVLIEKKSLQIAALVSKKEDAKDVAKMLVTNLSDEKNSTLRNRVLTGDLPVEALCSMTDRDLANPELQKEWEAQFAERMQSRNMKLLKAAMRNSSNLFTCPSCGKRDQSMEQRQTRSADEPMTIILTCNHCDRVWRKN